MKDARVHSAPSPAVYHLKSPFTYTRSRIFFPFFHPLLLPFGEKETKRGSQNSLNSPNDMKVMKVIRATCYPEQVAPSWHALHLLKAWRHAGSDVSLAVFLSLPHTVSLRAAAPCQTVSVPTPQAWGNEQTRVRLPCFVFPLHCISVISKCNSSV